MQREAMYKQVQSLPSLFRDWISEIDELIKRVFLEEDCQGWERVFLVGCGDSYYTGLATELAWERLAGILAEPMTSFQFSRYAVPFSPLKTFLFGISNSGEVARSIEAMTLAKEKGLRTFAVTSNPNSRLASVAHKVLALEIPPMGISPGVRSYAIALLIIFFVVLYLAERRGNLLPEETADLKKELVNIALIIEKTMPEVDNFVKELADQLKGEENFVFLGGGPNYGTALFSAAKVVEACGASAIGQDIEEWAHVQCFTREKGAPIFIIAPSGSCFERAAELMPTMARLEKKVIVITDNETGDINQEGVQIIEIKGKIREEFSPLIYSLPAELLAYYLAEAKKESFFRMDKGVGPLLGRDVRKSKIIRRLSDLPL